MQLKNKTILVTGGSGGIGSLVVSKLKGEGANIIAISLTREEFPSYVEFVAADLSSLSSINDAASKITNMGIDIFLHLAGIQFFGKIEEQDSMHILNTYNIGLIAPIIFIKALLPNMKKHNTGQIAFVGSTFGSIPFAHFATYSSSKAGLKAFAEALRREVADTAIDVTYVAPRAVDTPLNNEKVREFSKITTMRMDKPEWVAGQIIKAIKFRKKDVYLGFPEKIFVRINAVLPRIIDSSVRKNDRLAANLFN